MGGTARQTRRPQRQAPGGQGLPGLGIDAYGGQVIDPTENVLALVAAEARRQDDLRIAGEQLQDEKNRATEEIAKLHSDHVKELNEVRAKYADTAIETLAKAHSTAIVSAASQLSQLVTSITERLAALEKSSYEGAGKQAVADPMMAELIQQVKNLSTSQQTRRGSDEGKGTYTATLIAVFAVLLSLIGTIASFFRH